MRYFIGNEAGEPIAINGVEGFNSKAEADAFIQDHLIKGGLDWRVGFFFKAREDSKPYQIFVKATGERLNPS